MTSLVSSSEDKVIDHEVRIRILERLVDKLMDAVSKADLALVTASQALDRINSVESSGSQNSFDDAFGIPRGFPENGLQERMQDVTKKQDEAELKSEVDTLL